MATAPLGRAFTAHLSALGLANLADGVVATGVPLLAISLTRSPFLIGLLTAAVWLPWLVCGIPAGVLVDRSDRRMTMIVALTVRAALLVAVVAVELTGHLTIWWLVALAAGYGVTEVFTDLAASARVPSLVHRERTRLQRANSRLLAVEQVGNGFVGRPLAGVLVGLGAVGVLGASAVAVALAVVVLCAARGRRAAAHPTGPEAPAASWRAELGAGMVTLWRHPVLRPLLLTGGLWNFASSAFSAVVVLWMVGPGSTGGLTPGAWALACAAMPAGALLGSALAGPVLRRWPEVPVMVTCWALGAAVNVVPLVWPTLPGLVTFFCLAAPVGVIGNVVSGSIRPRMVPERMLGKVGGASRVIGFGAMPLGALTGGIVAEAVGIAVVLGGVASVMMLAAVLLRLTVSQATLDTHDLSREQRVDG